MKQFKEIASKFDVSESTVKQIFDSLERTGGRQAQFNIAELGGMGQWQFGGMMMIGDMFNNTLKAKVASICEAVADLVINMPKDEKAKEKNSKKDTDTRKASMKGSQNDIHYAFYPSEKVLEITKNGKTKKYHTKDYQLSGVQQSQDGSGKKLSFSHPNGTVSVSDLKEIK